MENSAYVPSSGHLNTPALVVFSQAGSLQDALRIQRPFNSQFTMSDAAKNLHRPFDASTFGLRHMEAYGALPAHILNHLQPQFLHPGLSSLGSSAFRPLTDFKNFPSPSAFAPPKCLKVETTADGHGTQGHIGQSHGVVSRGIFSPSEDRFLGPSPRADSCSPASVSLSPQPQGQVKEESMEGGHVSEEGEGHHTSTDNDSPGVHEENRGFRIGHLFGGGFGGGGAGYGFTMPGLPSAAHALAKTSFLFDHDISMKQKKRDPSSCPVCGSSISPGDLETHFMYELERLYKLNGTGVAATKKKRTDSGRPPALPGDSGPEGRWETFQRIKTNRQGRLRLKIRKRKADENCLICVGRLHSPDGVNVHQQCARKNVAEDEETVDVEGDSELDEWAEGQRRRTSPMIIGLTRTPTSSGRMLTEIDNEADDVIVDGEEEAAFGPSQYTETDVEHCKSDDQTREKDGTQSQVATVNSSGDVEIKIESAGQQCDSNVSTSDAEPSSKVHMIEELRNRIRQLEAESGSEMTSSETDDYKCLICLEHYKKPVISTVCWHVHCEECWLHTLGSKKVCPQCSMITSASDLRRIYM